MFYKSVDNGDKSSFKVKAQEKIEEAASRILDDPAMTNAISSIPVFGPVFQTVLSFIERQAMQRRFLELLGNLREEVLLIDQVKIDRMFFDTEEFYDIFRKVLESSAKTRHNEKIKLYGRILVRTALLENARYRRSVEDFLIILAELSPADLVVGREIYKQQKDIEIITGKETFPEDSMMIAGLYTGQQRNALQIIREEGWDRLPQICGIDDVEFRIALIKLSRAGLIKEITGGFMDYTGGLYHLTPVFRRLMHIIQEQLV
jgi:hypothetical protein